MNKTALRSELLTRRREIDPSGAGEALLQVFLETGIGLAPVISCYWPIKDEIDTRPLIRYLQIQGSKVVLPRIEPGADFIRFHVLEGDEPASKDGFNIPAPSPESEVLRPDIMLVPLLGFDADGGRIGYGRGYYDRAIAVARSEGPVDVVGVGFAAQEVGEIPREAHDALLDWVITERGVKLRPS